MAESVGLTVDGREVEVPVGSRVIDACDLAGVYVPRLCAYPGLEAVGDCGLCFVRVSAEGFPAAARRACSVTALPGMVVDTRDQEALGYRLDSMKAILGDHPHVCLTCPQRDGCSRAECEYGIPPEQRCCGEFGHCEIGRVAAFVGALDTPPPYVFRALGTAVDHTIRRDLDLCIGCGRCVAACDTLPEAGSALELVETRPLMGAMTGGRGGGPSGGPSGGAVGSTDWGSQSYLARHVALPKAVEGDLRASGCTFCGACVLVCPSGSLTAAGGGGASWLTKRRARSTLRPSVGPPEGRLELSAGLVAGVPETAGVFRVFSLAGDVLQISGVPDLRAALEALLGERSAARAAAFTYESAPLYTQRESELLALHLQEHGSLPPGNDVAGDVFGDEVDAPS